MNLKDLLLWSEKEFSHLPWRKERSLYRTLVSEIMLQQTTVGTVKNHYEKFLSRFPDLESLAEASEHELTVAWKGLGYYRRARNLKKIAETIVHEHAGKFPQDIALLMKIPGIGPYTANALIGIGMDKKALAVDANLERVIARLWGLRPEKGPKLQNEIQKQFNENKIFNKKVSFRKLNEALMDLGRTYCQARKASCELCSLRKDCVAFSEGSPLSYPAGASALKKKAEAHELHLLRVLVLKKDKILAYKKSDSEWLSGQYEVPTYVLATTDKKLKQYPSVPKSWKGKPSFTFKTTITKYNIQNSVVVVDEKTFKALGSTFETEWKALHDQQSNFSTATLKAIKKL